MAVGGKFANKIR